MWLYSLHRILVWWGCCPERRKSIGWGQRHCSDIDIEREETILHIEFFEDFHHFFHQKSSSGPSLSHVMVIHLVLWPYSQSDLVQIFHVFVDYHRCWFPVFVLLLNVAANQQIANWELKSAERCEILSINLKKTRDMNLVILCFMAAIFSVGVDIWTQNSTASPMSGLLR